jgi:uncharacterized protein YllA (UPF0747 family)
MLDAFLRGDPQVTRWLGQSPKDAAAAKWPAEFLRQSTWPRAELTRIAHEFAAGTGASAATLANANLLGNADASAVVAGQQPAVGGGPTLILAKAAHAIALARSRSTPNNPCVPVFWCASEDHDLGEANHADLVCQTGDISRFTFDLDHANRRSLRFRPALAWWILLRDQCYALFGDGRGAGWLEDNRPVPGEGMGVWLCRLLHRLFAAEGLLALEGHALRPLWRQQLAQALEHWPRAELERRRAEIIAAGFRDAFGDLQEPPLFSDSPSERHALTRNQAVEALESDPDSISPGAALRPVLQQAALPAALFVAGPNELQYHAFLGPLYDSLRVARPRLVPRHALTIVSPWIHAGLERWGMRADTVTTSTEPKGPCVPSELESLLEEVRQRSEELALAGAQLAADPRHRLEAGLARLRRRHRRLVASLQRAQRRDAHLSPFGVLKAQLFPRGKPQDRVMTLFQALWLTGPELGKELVEAAMGQPQGGNGRIFVERPAI